MLYSTSLFDQAILLLGEFCESVHVIYNYIICILVTEEN